MKVRLDGAAKYAAKVLHFTHPSASLRWEDIEDIASEAWYLYFRHWEQTGEDHRRFFSCRVIDLCRRLCGKRGSRRNTLIACEADLGDRPSERQSATHHGFGAVDVADEIASMRHRGHQFVADAVELRLQGDTLKEACSKLHYHTATFAHARRRAYRRTA